MVLVWYIIIDVLYIIDIYRYNGGGGRERERDFYIVNLKVVDLI